MCDDLFDSLKYLNVWSRIPIFMSTNVQHNDEWQTRKVYIIRNVTYSVVFLVLHIIILEIGTYYYHRSAVQVVNIPGCAVVFIGTREASFTVDERMPTKNTRNIILHSNTYFIWCLSLYSINFITI